MILGSPNFQIKLGNILTNAGGTAWRDRGFHTPDRCEIAFKIIILGKLMYFLWQLLIILFADDKAKNMELHLFVLRDRKTIFLVRQISARQRGAVMAFIPDCRSLVSRPKTIYMTSISTILAPGT